VSLYTKDGRPLQESGDYIYSASGVPVGRRRGDKVFGPDGRYVGTITGNRLVYRSTDSASISSPFSVANRAGSGRAHAAGSAIWGDEPKIPD
jgi:hypothetical protein